MNGVKSLLRHRLVQISIAYYLVVVLWWFKIHFWGKEVGSENYLFNLSYFFFNAVGGGYGLYVAFKRWGGWQSSLGRGMLFLALGLLGQGFGLLIWTYYNLVLRIEVPYPSLADIGYFSLIPFYTLAMINLAQATGVKAGLKSVSGLVQVILVPLVVFLVSYLLFIRDIGIDFSQPIRTFLDFGYPAGEAISVSLGLLTLGLSRGILGGKMKNKVFFIISALVFQYITEFSFLYSSGKGIYFNASIIDLMYATSYFLMGLALVWFSQFEELDS